MRKFYLLIGKAVSVRRGADSRLFVDNAMPPAQLFKLNADGIFRREFDGLIVGAEFPKSLERHNQFNDKIGSAYCEVESDKSSARPGDPHITAEFIIFSFLHDSLPVAIFASLFF
jgi:hypothetical protein